MPRASALSNSGTHERLRGEERVKGSSDRSFGFTVAAACAALAALKVLFAGSHAGRWFTAAVVFFALAMLLPGTLRPLNRLWTRLGLTLHRILTPLMLLAVYFGAIAPTGILMRVFRKDLLRLHWAPDAKTYWIDRSPPGPRPPTLRRQY